MPKVEFHFDFGSPNAYLAHLVIPEIERRTGVKFEYVPVLLGGVYKLTGNRSPGESLAGIKNKPDYERLETARFIKRHGITRYRPNPFFPVNTLTIMRGAIAAQRLGVFERYVDEIYRHMWSEPKKLDDPGVLRAGRRRDLFRQRPAARCRGDDPGDALEPTLLYRVRLSLRAERSNLADRGVLRDCEIASSLCSYDSSNWPARGATIERRSKR